MLMANNSNSNMWSNNNEDADDDEFDCSPDDMWIDLDLFNSILSENSDHCEDDTSLLLLNNNEDKSCDNSIQTGVVPFEANGWSQQEFQNGIDTSEDVHPIENGLPKSSEFYHSENMMSSGNGGDMDSEQMFEFPESSGMKFDGDMDSVSRVDSPLRTCSVSLTDWSTMSTVDHDTCSSRQRGKGVMNVPLGNYGPNFIPDDIPNDSTEIIYIEDPTETNMDLRIGSLNAMFGNNMENPEITGNNIPASTGEVPFIDVGMSFSDLRPSEVYGNQVSEMHRDYGTRYTDQYYCEHSSAIASNDTSTVAKNLMPHHFGSLYMESKEEQTACMNNRFKDNKIKQEAEESVSAVSATRNASEIEFSNTSNCQGTSFKYEDSSHYSSSGIETSCDDGSSSSDCSKKLFPDRQSFVPRKKEMFDNEDDFREKFHESKRISYHSLNAISKASGSTVYTSMGSGLEEGLYADLSSNQFISDARSQTSTKHFDVSVKDERKAEFILPRNASSHHTNVNGIVKSNSSVYSSSIDDEADLCILEDLSAPRTVPPMRIQGESLTQRPVVDPLYSMGMEVARIKSIDERITLRVALQDLSQPKSEITPPDGALAVSLLRHQRIALSWMVQKESASLHCSGGILADDQGLGKTISTIALLLTEKPPSSKATPISVKQIEPKAFDLDDDEDGGVLQLNGMKQDRDSCQDIANESPVKNENAVMLGKGRPAAGTLVVCPTSVLRQWADELQNKVSKEANLNVLTYHGSNRTKDPFELAKYDVVLTTYSIVSMEVPKQPLVDKDDEEKGQTDGHGLSLEFSSGKKRKYPPSGDKKGRKNKKGMEGALLESTARPLARVGWFRVVLDEAQSIKNHRTQVARACWGLRAKRRWCLSGTPIQNSIDDLYSYFRFLRYDPYAAYKSFCSMIKVPISRNPINGYKKLQAVLKTIMLRRTKGTMLDGEPIINLPPKSVELKRVSFSTEERDFYSKLEADSRAQFKVYAAAGTVKQNYVNILLMLLRLRQACDHPLLVKGYDSSSVWRSSIETAKKLPMEKQVKLLNCLEACLDICGICNDPPEDAVITNCGHIFCNQCILEYLTGDENICPAAHCKVHLNITSVFSRDTLRSSLSDQPNHDNSASQPVETREPCSQGPSHSSKIKAALEVLESLSRPLDSTLKDGSLKLSNGVTVSTKNSIPQHKRDTEKCLPDSSVKEFEKAIVFSQWTRMLDLLEVQLKNSSIQYRRLDGTMSVHARDKAVKDFNTIPEVTVMIMSLKAASLGLNMVAACHVILLDLWWNPTTEDQAIDRAHRIGQTRPVTVLRLTVKDTVEDRILALQQKKRVMVASAFGEDETGSRQTRLTVDDLKYLFMA